MLDTRKVAKALRLSHWARLIQSRNQSGLSVIEWCRNNGTSPKTFYNWQRRVREAMCEELLAHQSSDQIVADESPPSWAVCEVAPTTESQTLPIEINGCRILANMNTSPELLAKICKVLMSLC